MDADSQKLDGPHTGQEERCARVGALYLGLDKTGDKPGSHVVKFINCV